MSETVQGPDFSPLYRQVKELLLQRVVSGVWKPGEGLPSETKLAEQFNVSQGTVRKALEEMVAEHVVVRHQGKGTFVAARGEDSPVHFFSMTARDHGPFWILARNAARFRVWGWHFFEPYPESWVGGRGGRAGPTRGASRP